MFEVFNTIIILFALCGLYIVASPVFANAITCVTSMFLFSRYFHEEKYFMACFWFFFAVASFMDIDGVWNFIMGVFP